MKQLNCARSNEHSKLNYGQHKWGGAKGVGKGLTTSGKSIIIKLNAMV